MDARDEIAEERREDLRRAEFAALATLWCFGLFVLGVAVLLVWVAASGVPNG